ncbi:MAG TPA: hypothetical protein VNH46_05040 [Gemmatimonadales bacterium]|nr:hypothetical protein [Gemmatimonadales bacterium]
MSGSGIAGLTIELVRRERPLTRVETAQIRTELVELRRIATGLRSCEVTITGFGRGPGGLARAYAFRLGLALADSELEIGRNARPTFEEALRDAFGAAQLMLAEYERRRRAIALSQSELGAERRQEWDRPRP